MKITLTDADYEAALFRQTPAAKEMWERVKADAQQEAARRRLKENQKRVGELLALVCRPGTDDWSMRHRELDKLFAEHDKLLEIAYPMAREAEEGP